MAKDIKITHVGASSIGRLVGTVNGILALAAGIIGSVVAISDVVATQDYSILMNIGVSAAIVLAGIVVFPLLAFVFGWVYGVLVGIIWNLLLGTAGGLDVHVEDIVEPTKK